MKIFDFAKLLKEKKGYLRWGDIRLSNRFNVEEDVVKYVKTSIKQDIIKSILPSKTKINIVSVLIKLKNMGIENGDIILECNNNFAQSLISEIPCLKGVIVKTGDALLTFGYYITLLISNIDTINIYKKEITINEQ